MRINKKVGECLIQELRLSVSASKVGMRVLSNITPLLSEPTSSSTVSNLSPFPESAEKGERAKYSTEEDLSTETMSPAAG